MMKKIVIAYSGGLDTSVILHWIKKKYELEVIAFCANIGQGDNMKEIETKAIHAGAKCCYTDDLQEEFARDFIFPMMQAGAIYENQYLLGTSIARPLIMKRMLEIASECGADMVAHGATGKGNDQMRFELTAAFLAPTIRVLAPWREEEFLKKFTGRSSMIQYCKENNLPIIASIEKPYSIDSNLLHTSYEAGNLEDPWFDAFSPENRSIFQLSVSPEDAPNIPEIITLEFEQGICVSLNGEKLSPSLLLKKLNQLGGKHGIGRVDMVENRFVGMKSRGIYETPGGTILHIAHRQIESLTMDRELMHLRDTLIPKYSEFVYNGFWFSPERIALQEFIKQSQTNITGTIRLRLYKGNVIISGRKSNQTLYNKNLSSMEDSCSTYNQQHATGFINLQSLRLRNYSLSQESNEMKK